MFKVGEDVITMAAPGRFRVVSVAGDQVTIESVDGVRKTVLAWNLRPIGPSAAR